jgi:hypothetical protein
MYRYRKAGPSGRGEGRTRYYVDLDDEMGIRYIGTIEGKAGDWTHDVRGGKRFTSREAASKALPRDS